MSGWSSHGIDHVSPSQINLMANEPAMWIMEYLLGHKVPRGARAVRGIAVEMAVVAASCASQLAGRTVACFIPP